MQSPFGPLFLLLLGISVVITYLAIRRGQIGAIIMLAVGSVIDVILFGLFSLAQGNSLAQAIVVGLILGIVFNSLTVMSATFFRRNEQDKTQMSARKS